MYRTFWLKSIYLSIYFISFKYSISMCCEYTSVDLPETFWLKALIEKCLKTCYLSSRWWSGLWRLWLLYTSRVGQNTVCTHSCLCCHWVWVVTGNQYCILFYFTWFPEFSLNNWCYFVVAGKSNFKSSISLSLPNLLFPVPSATIWSQNFYLLQKFLIRN